MIVINPPELAKPVTPTHKHHTVTARATWWQLINPTKQPITAEEISPENNHL